MFSNSTCSTVLSTQIMNVKAPLIMSTIYSVMRTEKFGTIVYGH